MGNTTTHMHPTRLFEAVGAKRTVGHRLLEFFTHRPFAKLVSLGLATLLVFLIDSELTDDLYYEPINVVTEGQGKSRNDLEVQIHPDFIILPLAADEEKPRLRIRGFKKLKEEIPVPLKASIPESRLVGVGVGRRSVPGRHGGWLGRRCRGGRGRFSVCQRDGAAAPLALYNQPLSNKCLLGREIVAFIQIRQLVSKHTKESLVADGRAVFRNIC